MVLVVKAGGRVLKSNMENLIRSISYMKEKVILVHGGGDQVTELSKKLGIEPKFITSPEGIRSRYTSREELDAYIMAMGLINKSIVSKLVSMGKKALGISGVDCSIIEAERKKRIAVINERGRKMLIDGGYTGKITRVDGEAIEKLFGIADVLVLSPIAIDKAEGAPLNVDSDQVAKAVAIGIKAETLIFLTDVEGIVLNGSVLKVVKVAEAKELSAKIGAGMNRKLLMAAEAVSSGVKRAIISSGMGEDPISFAIGGQGTVIEQ